MLALRTPRSPKRSHFFGSSDWEASLWVKNSVIRDAAMHESTARAWCRFRCFTGFAPDHHKFIVPGRFPKPTGSLGWQPAESRTNWCNRNWPKPRPGWNTGWKYVRLVRLLGLHFIQCRQGHHTQRGPKLLAYERVKPVTRCWQICTSALKSSRLKTFKNRSPSFLETCQPVQILE